MKKTTKTMLRKAMLAATICASSIFAVGTMTACNGGVIAGNGAISLDETAVTMYVSDTLKLKVTTAEEGAAVTWSSSNQKVATVKRGTVSAKGVGKATITASLADGTSATCEITVLDRTVTISQTEATINLDDEGEHTVQLTAESSDGGAITWTSSDTSIATVSDGVVTAVGDEIGEVIITASRGSAYAECVVTVIMPSRPESFKRLQSAQNTACIADPGNWHYFVDGSSGDVTFANKPFYQLGEDGKDMVGYSISGIAETFLKENGESKKIFLRYQAAKDTATGEAIEVGDTYTIEYDVLCNKDTHLTFGSSQYGGADVTANEVKHVSFKVKLSGSTPLAIRPSFNAAPSAEEPFTILFSGITITKNLPETKVVNEDTTPVLPIDDTFTAITGSGEITEAKNSVCVAEPGTMHYFADGRAGSDYVFAKTPSWAEDGTSASYTMSKVADGFYYFRYQPTLATGKTYAITFTVESTQNGYLKYGSEGAGGFKEKTITANTPVTITYYGEVNGSQPFSVAPHDLNGSFAAVDESNPLTFTISNIAIKEAEIPNSSTGDEEIVTTYNLEKKSNSDTIKVAGTWTYIADGTNGTNYQVEKAAYEDGVVTLSFSKMTSGKNYQLRYQPTKLDDGTVLNVGDQYTISMTVTVSYNSTSGEFVYGKDSKAFKFTQAGEYTISWSGELASDKPFMVQFKDYDATAENPYTITLSNITIVKYEEPAPDVDKPTPGEGEEVNKTDLPKYSKKETLANPGVWAYNMADATAGTLKEATITEDGKTITYSFDTMTAGKDFYLRYQPNLEVGKEYKLTFTATMNVAGTLNTVLSDDKTGFVKYTFEAGVAQEITFSQTVQADKVIQFVFRSTADVTTENGPAELILSNVTLEEVVSA